MKVCLNDKESEEVGEKIVSELFTQLGLCSEDLLKGAYLDLLCQRQKEQNETAARNVAACLTQHDKVCPVYEIVGK